MLYRLDIEPPGGNIEKFRLMDLVDWFSPVE